MEADDYKKLKEVFQSAVEVSGEERSRLLDEKCAGDAALRAAVEKLLASNDTEFLETPAAGNLVGSLGGKPSSSSISGQRIGHYNVERKIGSGGMGDVYLAVDGKLGRRVAIKILPEEFTLDEDRLDRFQLEARAASALSHPNILTIHEIGEWEGTHYIATEYVEGETLRHRLTREPLSVAETLEFGIQLVSAIAAAHEAGICHRDIKPENIMVRRDGIVKVVDFGLAKLNASPFRADSSSTADDPTVKIVRTEPGVIMGTVQYMSPEQTRGLPTDERSDIWSLGCVLYEMLAGTAPFVGESSADLIAEIVKTHPVPLASVNDEVPERLDEIVAKALEKNPDERYQSAKDLLIDLKRLKRRFDVDTELERSNPRITNTASDEVVISGPNIISTKKGPKDLTEVNSAEYLYWGMKAHRWTAIGITLFVIGLVGGTAMLVRYYWRETDPNEARLEYFSKIKMAAQAIETSNLSLARNLLDEVAPKTGNTDFRSFEWGYLNRLYRDRSASQPLVLSREKWVSAVAFSPDGKHLATAGADNHVTIWDLLNGREIRSLNGHSQWITSVEFSPDGRRLLSGGFDKTVKVWDIESGSDLLTLTAPGNGISQPTFLENGTAVAAIGNGAIRVWDAVTGKESAVIHEPVKDNMAFRFSADEKLLAVRDDQQNITIIDVSSEATVAKMKGHTDLIISIRFSPDSKYLLTGSADATAKLWDIKTGKEIRPFKGHTETIQPAVFSPDGKIIATGSNDDSIKVWSTEDGVLIDTLRGHTGDISTLDFSSDGSRLASGGGDNRIRIWPVPHTPPQGVLRGHSKPINQVTFSKDSRMLASTSEDGTARIWEADTERQRLLLEHQDTNVLSAAFSHDGKTLATGGPKSLKLWSTISGRVPRTTIFTNSKIGMLAFSADDKLIATEGEKNIPIWEVSTGQQRCSLDHAAWTAEFVANSNRIITSGDNSVKTWDLKTCNQISEFKGDEGFAYYSVFSKMGKTWAFQVLNEGRSLKLIDTASGKEIASFFGHEAAIWAVDFTPDGKRLATADSSGLIKIWDVSTGHDLLTLKANVGELSSIDISPDGNTLAAAGHDGIVRLFRSTF